MANVWADYEATRMSISSFTVDKLKLILTGFSEECYASVTKSGRKQELVDRVLLCLSDWRTKGATSIWTTAKTIITQVRSNSYTPPHARASSSSTSSSQQYSSNQARPPNYGLPPSTNPYARPRYNLPTSPAKPNIRFKESPFFQAEEIIGNVVECPESSSATDRRSKSFDINLTSEQMGKLKDGSNHQLRLFCTSSTFYSSAPYRQNVGSCPIEFPPTCEVRINNSQLNANTKGMKKKPGTAPPPNITEKIRFNMPNRIEMVYVNTQQPVTAKKFYLVVMLVRGISVDKLVEKLKTDHRRSAQQIKADMLASAKIDDDIIAGASKMSLKCPLSYVRISTPCRSSRCVHSQCFDALSWYSVMEQTTTWLCPVCERILDPQDLILDGYFEEIVNQTPEAVEDVIVEADGEWHTEDNKYGSPFWSASHRPKAATPPAAPKKASPAPVQVPKPAATEVRQASIVIVDSDDEDEGLVTKQLASSTSFAQNSTQNATQSQASVPPSQEDVIDLTLDSDDEAPPPPRPSLNGTGKRKASEAELDYGEGLWKKSRSSEAERSGVVVSSNTNGARIPNANGVVNGGPPKAPGFASLMSATIGRPGGGSVYPYH